MYDNSPHSSDQIVGPNRVMLTEDEEGDLFLEWLAHKESNKLILAERALSKLIMHYTPIIRKMVRKMSGYEVDRDELVSEGLLGLVEAANRFDPFREIRFSTYARSWIRGVLFTFITKNYFITNVCMNNMNKKLFFALRRSIAIAIKKNGHFEMTEDLIQGLMSEFEATRDEILTMNNILRSPYESLNVPVGEADSDLSRQDLLESTFIGPEDNAVAKTQVAFHKTLINTALDTLNPRERAIYIAQRLQEREDIQTLESLGQKFEISKERVRQIRSKAEVKFQTALTNEINSRGLDRDDLFLD